MGPVGQAEVRVPEEMRKVLEHDPLGLVFGGSAPVRLPSGKQFCFDILQNDDILTTSKFKMTLKRWIGTVTKMF